MAAVFRQPLAPRPVVSTNPQQSLKAPPPFVLKRPRSPDPIATYQNDIVTAKRHRTQSANGKENGGGDKKLSKSEREARENEFKIKYTKAFPSWTFYFDTTDAERGDLATRVVQLNARVAKFFSNEVTHFITNRTVTPDEPGGNKENTSKGANNASLRSPIKLKGLPEDATFGYEQLVRKAEHFGMKIWHTTKLDSVLRRCSVPALTLGLSAQPTRSLTSLLESEKRFGTTTERDPTQRRHDYRYFSRGSYFVLVEDIRQELATIAAHEYIFIRTVEGEEKGSWPVAYCHPLSRNPFIPYDLKEERRRERMERAEKQREEERAAEVKRIRAHQIHQRKQNDLRRSVSLSNLHRSFKVDHCDMLEPAFRDDHGASGFDSNAYIAASGNSMSIASTFGTTSTMGAGSSTMSGLGIGNRLLRNGTLPAEVTTSRRVGTQEPSRSTSFSKASASSAMMPPPEIPDRSRNLLRKCKSTNTLRQPKRDERAKPGYCESCKQKFEDFKVHVRGRRHQKFANNESNFLQLDFTLSRLRRKTKAEVEMEEAEFQYQRSMSQQPSVPSSTNSADEEMPVLSSQGNSVPDVEVAEDGTKYVYLDDDEDDTL